MKNKLFVLALAVIMLFSMTGCSAAPFDSENMLRPPKTSGADMDICEALASHLGRQPLFRYPRSGEHRSAITMMDLDNDKTDEAIVFYVASSENPLASIAVLDYMGGRWKVAATAEGLAGNVNTLLFGNLIPDRQGTEIIVGWSVGSGSGLLTVYSYSKNRFETVIIEETGGTETQSVSGYTGVAVCDMDGDGTDEIMTASLNTVNGTSLVRMLKYMSGEGAERLFSAGICSLDGSVSRYSKITVGMLADTTQALIIDSYKGSDTICTEAVCWDKLNVGLSAPFNSAETGMVSGTDRAAIIDSFDADMDGLTEIPMHTLLPCYSENSEQKFYRTSWFSYDFQTASMSSQSELDTILNTADGYYMFLPPSWPSDITVRYDQNYRTLTFCTSEVSYETITVSASDLTGSEKVLSVDHENDSAQIERRIESFGSELFRLRAVEAEDRALIPSYSYQILREENNTIWAVQLCTLGEEYGMTYNVIKACFYLL